MGQGEMEEAVLGAHAWCLHGSKEKCRGSEVGAAELTKGTLKGLLLWFSPPRLLR